LTGTPDRVTFYRVGSSTPLGSLWLDNGALAWDPELEDLARAALATHPDPATVMRRYADWSNGYIFSRSDERPAGSPTPDLSGASGSSGPGTVFTPGGDASS